MDCIKVSQNIEDYLHGELGRVRHQALARHLDGCAACSASVEFETRYLSMLSAKLREATPPGLRERILDALGKAALPSDLGGGTSDLGRVDVDLGESGQEGPFDP